ncbi:MAG TPA: LuxR C-terminal-related transcriptional regulator [Steroidobacteraceae bacterium]|jgi:LuxR family maltose regulon positive regulatory protein|nr:LuxR C-terminal-related transcriptional regulator [Steroidobacteraceae bacterium]
MKSEEWLTRPRLTLSEPGRERRVTLLLAPTGYGKTVLLRQWRQEALARNQRVAWLDLDERHRQSRRLLTDLLAALRAAGVQPSAGFLRRHRGIESVGAEEARAALAELAGGLSRRAVRSGQAAVLVMLDRLECLSDSSASAELQTFVNGAGAGLQVVLASRVRPALQLGALYLRGAVYELGTAELRFTAQEAAAYLASIGATAANPMGPELIVERTEGWPAGLRLFGGALCGHSLGCTSAAAMTSESERMGVFFAEQVLAGQPAELRSFLLQTAILEKLSPALCDAITGANDGGVLLEECERRGLFVHRVRGSPDEFNRHRLLCEYLRRELRRTLPQEEKRLHKRAGEWLLRAGRFEEAFEHVLAAGEPARAAEILDGYYADPRGGAVGRKLLRLTAQLPRPVRDHYPRILLALAWGSIFWWEFDQADEALRACRRRLDQLGQLGATGEEREALQDFEHLYLHSQMILALLQDDTPRVQELCDRLIREYVSASPWVKASLLISLIQAHTDQYRLKDAESLAARARKLLERSEHPLAQIPLVSAMAQVRLVGGLDQAGIEDLTRETENAAQHPWPEASASATMVALPLAQMHYERNELERARELLDRHLPPVPNFGFLEGEISGRLVRSRLLRLSGDIEGSLAALEMKAAWAPEGGLQRLRRFFAADRIRLLLQIGRLGEAMRVGRESGALGPLDEMLPGRGRASACKEVRAMGFVRLAQAQGRAGEALKVCAQWRSFLYGAQAVRGIVRWEALSASVLVTSGQTRAAQRALRHAILTGAPGRHLRSILDEGPWIGELLLDNPQLIDDLDGPAQAFGRLLIAAFEREMHREVVVSARSSGARAEPAPSAAVRPEPAGARLSAREIELLKMVTSGLINREMAERLAMTEGSVKWYLHHVYKKLGVNRRTGAVRRARELGIVR